MNEMDEGSSLRSSEPSVGGHEERVTLTRAELMSGILVGIGGEHDVVPSQEQLDRTVDMIFRYVRRRDALATQGAARMLAPLLWPQLDPSPEAPSAASTEEIQP